MLKVGMPGNIGSIELQDLIFTNRGPTAGLVAVEWNVRAETPGSAGIWGESSTRQGVGRIGRRDHKRRKFWLPYACLDKHLGYFISPL